MSRLFGTDGIRGLPGEPPLDEATVRGLGGAFAEATGCGRYLIGTDTRESGPALVEAFSEGLRAAGGEAVIGGVLPTPAVSLLVAGGTFAGGVVVSASHNPWQDNGLKLLSSRGEKLSDASEDELQAALENGRLRSSAAGAILHEEEDWPQKYRAALAGTGPDLAGLRVAIDSANGAMYHVAGDVFRDLGADVVCNLGASPDGRNINQGCGSLHPDRLAEAVRESGADLGVAFDGDGDRAILVDESGAIRDGDDVLYVCGTDRHDRGALPGPGIVGTVMTNVGLENALAREGIALHRAPVGDRYVLEELRRRDLVLGGEPSGHVIFLDRAVTGDGLLTAVEVAGTLRRNETGLGDACSGWMRCPQVLQNVPVAKKVPLQEVAAVRAAREAAEEQLGERGRVLLRYSGTERLLRVMLEGPDADEIRALADEIAEAARTSLSS